MLMIFSPTLKIPLSEVLIQMAPSLDSINLFTVTMSYSGVNLVFSKIPSSNLFKNALLAQINTSSFFVIKTSPTEL